MWRTITFSWATPLLSQGSLHQLQIDDLPPLSNSLRPTICGELLWEQWAQEIVRSRTLGQNPSLLRTLINTYGPSFFWLGTLELVNCSLNFAAPLFLNLILQNLSNLPEKSHQTRLTPSAGYACAALLAASLILKAVINTQYAYRQGLVAARMRAALTTCVFRAVLKLSTAVMSEIGSGRVQTLMSVDADRVVNLCLSFHQLWSLPLQISIALGLLYTQVSYAFLAGLSVVLLLLPLNRWLALRIQRASIKMMTAKDRRVQILMEVLRGMKQIKSYVWEPFFRNQVATERRRELAALSVRKYLDAFCVYLWAATSLLFSVATFGLFALMGQQLTAPVVFTSLALFNVLIAPLNAFPWVINGVVEALVSVKRVGELLTIQAASGSAHQCGSCFGDHTPETDRGAAVTICGADFGWATTERGPPCSRVRRGPHTPPQDPGAAAGPGDTTLRLEEAVDVVGRSEGQDGKGSRCVLSGVDLEIPIGALAVIVGEVGAGKSALLSAMLGELQTLWGTVAVRGSVAFVGQQPWVQRGSIRENILFGASMEHQRYQEAVHACCLDQDLHAMPAGDLSLVGEEGSRLSGGQRARLALARALYSDRDVYLLDDVLAGLDAHVSAWLIRHAILGPRLRTKTVVAVTNSPVLLAAASHVMRVDRGGSVTVSSVRPGAVRELRCLGAGAAPHYGGMHAKGDGPADDGGAAGPAGGAGVVGCGIGAPEKLLATSSHLERAAGVLHQNSSEVQVSPTAGCFKGSVANEEQGREEEEEEEEERGIGHMPPAVYVAYARATGWGWVVTIVSSLALMQATRNGSDLWLSYWVTATTPRSLSPGPTLSTAGTASRLAVETQASTIPGAAGSMLGMKMVLHSIDPNSELHFYLGVLLAVAAANSLFTLVRAFSFAKGGMVAAARTHLQLLDTMLQLPMSFFDTTPTGRIINRFSSDTATVDDSLPFILNILLANLASLVGVAVVLVLTQPAVLLLVIPLTLLYKFLQQYYRCTSRELRRLEALARSPVYTTFSEVLSGGCTIRAFGAEQQYQSKVEDEIDAMQRVGLASLGASNWLSLRLQLVAAALAGLMAWVAVLQHQGVLPGGLAMSAGLVGLSLAYVLPITGLLNGLLTSSAETEQEMVAMERLLQYQQLQPSTALQHPCCHHQQPRECQHSPQALALNNSKGLTEPLLARRAPDGVQVDNNQTSPAIHRPDWLQKGHIVFQHVWLRYSVNARDILQDVCLEVHPGTRLGICGRTGGGKSSLVSCLLRLTELSRGQILIDGQDIAAIPLWSLRSAIGLVPQHPFIFQGSVRQNLDPFQAFTDDHLVFVLQCVRLWDQLLSLASWRELANHRPPVLANAVCDSELHRNVDAATQISGNPHKHDEHTVDLYSAPGHAHILKMQIGGNGLSLSVGQQQLLCLARVLLKQPQILCLDECTASIDPATASIIHAVKVENFRMQTVVEIAHQMDSILDSDVVAVMEAGKIVELGQPNMLRCMENSKFGAMISMH